MSTTGHRLFLPDRFIARSGEEFSAAAGIVGAQFWHRHRLGEVDQRTRIGLRVRGAYEAVQWLSGSEPCPPGFFVARARTRYDLLDVLRITELACNDEVGRWESVVRGSRDGVLEAFDADLAGGAREVYEWAVGLRANLSWMPLLDEDEEAARAHFRQYQRRAAARAAADAQSPYQHLRDELAVSVTVFATAVRALEQLVASGATRNPVDEPVADGALAVGRWILGEAGHPVTGQPVRVTRQSIAAAVDEVIEAVYGARTLDRTVGQAMVDMLHYALGQAGEPPFAGDMPATRAA